MRQFWGLLDGAAGLVLLGTPATWPLSAHACDSWLPVLQQSPLLQPRNRLGRIWFEGPSVLLGDLSFPYYPNSALLFQNLQGRVFSISGYPKDCSLRIWEKDVCRGALPSLAEGPPRCQLLVLALLTTLPPYLVKTVFCFPRLQPWGPWSSGDQ